VKTKLYTTTLVLAFVAAAAVVYAAQKDANESPPAAGPDANVPAPKEAIAIVSDSDKFSYATGVQMAQSFKRQGVEVNVDLLVRGIRDALADKPLAMDQQEMRKVIMEFRQKAMSQWQGRQNPEAARNLAEGNRFLEANKGNEGVKVLASGLQYKVIREGTGKTPTANDRVKTHYRGRLIDGTQFDSSYSRGQPQEFGVGKVIPGWTEALQLMKEGAKWELYIPPSLAYRERGMPPAIAPNATLIFEIELIEVLPQKPATAPRPDAATQPRK